MTDGHIHIERGPYTLDWIRRFADKAVQMQLDEIRLLEHCYLFEEFKPMYGAVAAYSDFNRTWFQSRAGIRNLQEYLELIRQVRQTEFPVKILFGLEVCYIPGYEDLVAEVTQDKGFDFLLGSVHFIDGFAYDHKPELWDGIDVDDAYRRYFEDSVALAQCGIFHGIGHPDAIKLFGHKPSYALTDSYEHLAAALAKSKMYADQNSGVARRCPNTASLGMDTELLSILKKHNVPFVTSSDAHCPEDVGAGIAELNECMRSCH